MNRFLFLSYSVFFCAGCSSPVNDINGTEVLLKTTSNLAITSAEERDFVLFGINDTLQLVLNNLDPSSFEYQLGKGLFWESSNEEVFIIDETGKAISCGFGSASVKAVLPDTVLNRDLNVVPNNKLPYAIGSTFEFRQGWNGKYSHTGSFRYSYDFIMPIGTEIRAAQGGVVVAARDSGERNGSVMNFMVIQHEDGTDGRYFHLTKGGVLKEIGDEVVQGELIALSGNTGNSLEPHLHFDITSVENDRQTIPFYFSNTSRNYPKGLPEGFNYKAQ